MKTKRLNIKMVEGDHRELKAKASQDGKTLQSAVVQAIRDWVRREK